jgi:tetratricopeptide (TPR) repeat protein
MKSRLFFLSLLAIIVLFGMVIPNGIRAAAANNAWSVLFINQTYQNDDIDPRAFSPPEAHKHAGLLLANLALKKGDIEYAEKFLFPLLDSSDQLVLEKQAQIVFLKGNYQEAVKIWRILGRWFTLEQASRVISSEGEIDDLIFVYQNAYELFPERYARQLVRATLRKADQLFNDRQYDQAILTYQRIINQFPEERGAFSGLAQAYFSDNQYHLAHQTIQQGWELNSGEIKYYLDAAHLYEQMGFPDEALQAYIAALKIDPDSGLARQGIDRLEGADE